jgi:hypothetical protein
LSNNPIATISLIVAFSILVISITIIYLVAFFQGRAISFWPPKIGAKPDKVGDNISHRSAAKKRTEKLKFEEFPREWQAQIWKSDQGWQMENIEVYCTLHNLRLQVGSHRDDPRNFRSSMLTTSICSDCQREGRHYQPNLSPGYAVHAQYDWQSFKEEIKSRFMRKVELENQ